MSLSSSAPSSATLKVDNRLQTYTTNNAYLTLKDHKPNFVEKKALQTDQPCKKPNREDKQTAPTRHNSDYPEGANAHTPIIMAQCK